MSCGDRHSNLDRVPVYCADSPSDVWRGDRCTACAADRRGPSTGSWGRGAGDQDLLARATLLRHALGTCSRFSNGALREGAGEKLAAATSARGQADSCRIKHGDFGQGAPPESSLRTAILRLAEWRWGS